MESAKGKLRITMKYLKVGGFFEVEILSFKESPCQCRLATLAGAKDEDSRKLRCQILYRDQ